MLSTIFFRALTSGKQLRARGPQPDLSDAEVITIQIVGEFLYRIDLRHEFSRKGHTYLR